MIIYEKSIDSITIFQSVRNNDERIISISFYNFFESVRINDEPNGCILHAKEGIQVPWSLNFLEYELVLQIVLRAPNRTRTLKVPVKVIKLFCTRTHTQVEYKSVISRVSSIVY